LAALVSVLVVLSACGQSVNEPTQATAPARSDPEAEAAVVRAMINREAIGLRTGVPDVDDLFPGTGQRSVAAGGFLADVVGVKPGLAFHDNMSRLVPEPVPFDDPGADWRTFHVSVRVVETFVGDSKPGDELTLGLAFGSGLETSTVTNGFESMGQIVAFTQTVASSITHRLLRSS